MVLRVIWTHNLGGISWVDVSAGAGLQEILPLVHRKECTSADFEYIYIVATIDLRSKEGASLSLRVSCFHDFGRHQKPRKPYVNVKK
jgi:hypothetical protein